MREMWTFTASDIFKCYILAFYIFTLYTFQVSHFIRSNSNLKFITLTTVRLSSVTVQQTFAKQYSDFKLNEYS